MSKTVIYISNIRWDYAWHRQQEMVSFFAQKGYRILFVEPYQKNRPFSHSYRQIDDNIWGICPPGLPYERCLRSVNRINGYLLNRYLEIVLKELKVDNCILWIDRVHGIDFGSLCSGRYVIYDLIDELTAFGRWKNKNMLLQLENAVLRRADLLLSSSNLLLKRKLEQSGRKAGGLFIPNGVEVSRFADVGKKKSNHPLTVGFIGTISKRALNYALITEIAEKKPDWQLVFVGPGKEEDKDILRNAGVTVQDQVSGDEVPGVMSGFDVGIIPYNTANRDMDYVFPRKACEYLAAGLPVVSTDLPEIRELRPYVRIAESAEGFAEEIEAAMQESVSAQDRKSFVMKYDWHCLLNGLLKEIDSHVTE